MNYDLILQVLQNLNIESMDKGIIYHYTSSDSLLNILKEKRLWVSEVNFLNDSSELKFTIDILTKNFESDKALYTWYQSLSPGPHTDYILADNEFTHQFVSNRLEHLCHSSNIFILSTSLDSDSLTVWSNYKRRRV